MNLLEGLNDKQYDPNYCYEAAIFSLISFTASRLGKFDEAYKWKWNGRQRTVAGNIR